VRATVLMWSLPSVILVCATRAATLFCGACSSPCLLRQISSHLLTNDTHMSFLAIKSNIMSRTFRRRDTGKGALGLGA
jgi:hypothetical protein